MNSKLCRSLFEESVRVLRVIFVASHSESRCFVDYSGVSESIARDLAAISARLQAHDMAFVRVERVDRNRMHYEIFQALLHQEAQKGRVRYSILARAWLI